MPNFVLVYSAKQREALFRYVLDEELSIRKVLEAARHGALDGLEPADQAILGGMSYAYACGLVRDERHERGGVAAARKRPDKVATRLATSLLLRAEADVRLLTEKGKRTPMKPEDRAAAHASLKLARDAMNLLTELQGPKQAGGKAPTSAPSKPKGLAATIAASAATEPDDQPTEPNPDDGTSPTLTNEPEDSPNRSDEGPVRLIAASNGLAAAV